MEKQKTNIKKFSKEQYLILFELAFLNSQHEKIENVLQKRDKIGYGSSLHMSNFYAKINSLSVGKTEFIESTQIIEGTTDLKCILKFFDEKVYENIKFPENTDFLFDLLDFASGYYLPSDKKAELTKNIVKFLGKELFLDCVLDYEKKYKYRIDNDFINTAFNILHEIHKKIDKNSLNKHLDTFILFNNSYLYVNSAVSFYRKFKEMDDYLGNTVHFEKIFEAYKDNNSFISAIKKYELQELNRKLNSELTLNRETTIKQKL